MARERDPRVAEHAHRAAAATVATTWQQETVAESAREVHALGRELYERIGKVGDHFAKLGRDARQAPSARTTRRSARSRRACSSPARKLEEHGIRQRARSSQPDRAPRGRSPRRSSSSRAQLAISAGDADAA